MGVRTAHARQLLIQGVLTSGIVNSKIPSEAVFHKPNCQIAALKGEDYINNDLVYLTRASTVGRSLP
jgi:hypothetical protein